MKRQNVAAMARANGIAPQTAHNRILKGWTTEAATSTPARKYNRPKPKPKFAHGGKAEAVWAYLIANPLARPAEVSKATGVSYGYVHQLMSKVGTPREVFEAEAAAKAGELKALKASSRRWRRRRSLEIGRGHPRCLPRRRSTRRCRWRRRWRRVGGGGGVWWIGGWSKVAAVHGGSGGTCYF